MTKLSISDIQEVLSDVLYAEGKENPSAYNELASAFERKILILEEEKKNLTPKKKSKKEFVVVYDTSEDEHYIVQIGEDEEGKEVDIKDIPSILSYAGCEYNKTSKGKKDPIYNLFGVFQKTGKILKDRGVFLKSKEPIRLSEVEINI